MSWLGVQTDPTCTTLRARPMRCTCLLWMLYGVLTTQLRGLHRMDSTQAGIAAAGAISVASGRLKSARMTTAFLETDAFPGPGV